MPKLCTFYLILLVLQERLEANHDGLHHIFCPVLVRVNVTYKINPRTNYTNSRRMESNE